MLARAPARCIARQWTRVKHASRPSESVSYYHSKVTAIPFALNPREAIMDMSLHSGVLTGKPKHMLMFMLKQHFPSLKYEGLQPKKIEAIYFPAWIMDIDMVVTRTHVPARLDGVDKSIETVATLNACEIYYPGYSLFPLSLIILPIAGSLLAARPWRDDMAKLSDSTNVTCLPYTRSPFSVPDAVKSMSLDEALLMDRFHFDPTSIKFPLIAPVYPVLVPVYLIQYETLDFSKGPEQRPLTMTIILEAHKRGGAIYAQESIGEYSPEQWFLNAEGLSSTVYKEVMGYNGKISLAFRGRGSSTPNLTVYRQSHRQRMSDLWLTLTRVTSNWASKGSKGRITSLERVVRRWVDDRMLAVELALASATSSGKARAEAIDWDDLRVRQANDKEILSNFWFGQARRDWVLLKNQAAAAHEKSYMSESDPQKEADPPDFAACAEAEKQAETSKPGWLKEWEGLQEMEKRKPKDPSLVWYKRWKHADVNKEK